jgi:hypothetical protein
MALALLQNVVSTTVSRLREHPSMRSAMDTIIFTGCELIMAATCVGGPIILGGTLKRTAKTTFKISVNVVYSSFVDISLKRNCPNTSL